jgi:hypothetical protein
MQEAIKIYKQLSNTENTEKIRGYYGDITGILRIFYMFFVPALAWFENTYKDMFM